MAKLGRPRKTTGSDKRKKLRASWRKASEKYYLKLKKEKKKR